MSIIISVACLGSVAVQTGLSLSLAHAHVHMCLCLGWRKETVGICTVSKLIVYLVITNGQESARTTTAKDNLEKAYQSHGSV